MTPVVSASILAVPQRPVREDILFAERVGIGAIGAAAWRLERQGWEEGLAQLSTSAVPVAHLAASRLFTLDSPEAWPAERERLLRVLRAAHDSQVPVVYGTTGPAGTLSWEEATSALAVAVEPCLAIADSLGVALCFETTNQLRQDISFVYTLRDQLEVSRATGLDICLDLIWAWREPRLAATVREAGSRLRMMQVCDVAEASFSMPCRLVPGDGIIPLESILADIVRSGFRGHVDVELLGPQIDAEGVEGAISRGVRAAEGMLGRIDGATGTTR